VDVGKANVNKSSECWVDLESWKSSASTGAADWSILRHPPDRNVKSEHFFTIIHATCKAQLDTMPQTEEAAAWFAAVYQAVQEIPRGRVTSYGHIATLVGYRKYTELEVMIYR
jgi:hypothetical protein